MSAANPNSIPREPGRWPAIALALFVHAALFLFLWVGIRWQNDTPQTIEAEVWSPQEMEAAPPPPPPQPAVEPESVKAPPPEVKEVPVENPDIALEQEKKKKEEAKAREEEQAKQEKEKEKKLADEKKRQQALDDKKLAKLRQEDLKRIAAESARIDASGTAARAQGSSKDAAWAGRVKAKIKSNTHFLSSSDANEPVEFDLKLFPDGTVASVRKTKSSGIPEFDDAVRRAIDLSQPFPSDSSGRVPPNVTISHRPKDQ